MTPLERIIRPIVEGQIRGFLKEHPSIVEAVDWYNVPGRDKASTFIGSLSKRIVRDLTCGSSAARLAAALLATESDASPSSAVEPAAAVDPASLGRAKLSEPAPHRVRRRHLLRAPSSLSFCRALTDSSRGTVNYEHRPVLNTTHDVRPVPALSCASAA